MAPLPSASQSEGPTPPGGDFLWSVGRRDTAARRHGRQQLRRIDPSELAFGDQHAMRGARVAVAA